VTDWTAEAVPAENLTPRILTQGARLSLDLFSPGFDTGIDFPWWDTEAEIAAFADWIEDPSAPDFSDADQGWTFDAAHRDGRLVFRHGDLDTGAVFVTVSVERQAFVDRLRALLTSRS
jgi:hypothetical protein